MEKNWLGLPYHTIAEHYHRLFQNKVYKIPVSVVDDCPNRRGLKGMQTCVFCDVWGSAANAESAMLPLKAQIEKFQEHIRKKYKAQKFLVYFQAYTNTFTKISALKANFDTALSYPDVVGFVVGTRPDCISPAVLQLWQEYHERSFVAVELGVQSFSDEHLKFMRRGHSAQDSIKAIEKISRETTVDLGIHLIFGSPDETDQQIIETAKIVNDLPITNVKLHNLHVLTKTPLETMFHEGNFKPIEFQEYAERVQLFIEHLRPDIALHRLAALAPRWDELVAPKWTADKMGTHQKIVDFLRERKSYQSKKFSASDENQLRLKNNYFEKSQPLNAL